jgi:adenine phosphoribosyltransferase
MTGMQCSIPAPCPTKSAHPERARTRCLTGSDAARCVGVAVALHLHVGFVEVRKNPQPATASDAWILQTTPPDYRDRNLRLGIKRDLLKSGDRVLLVDDWIETGSQALATQKIVQQAGAAWLGVVTVVDALESNNIRRQLKLRSITHIRDL